tara:strand:- start:246 stop:569 length:324 start_codon:yes stop_codon:yes gene_type:complete
MRRKVGPGGGDFALNPNRFGGGSGLSIGGSKTKPKNPRSGKGKRSRKVPVSEKGKDFQEQKYKETIKVKVKFKDGSTHTDEVKGLNKGHALARAKSNWPGSAVIRIK